MSSVQDDAVVTGKFCEMQLCLAQASAKAIGCFAPWFPLIYISTFPVPNAGNHFSFLNTPLTQTCELTPESVTMNLARYGSRIEPGKKDCRDVLVNHTCMHLFLQKWIRGSVPEGHIQPWAEHPSLEKAPCRRATENLVSEEGQQRKTFGHQRSRGSWPHARTPPAPGRAQDG